MDIDEKRTWLILISLLGFIFIPCFFIGIEYILAIILLIFFGSKIMSYVGIL
jgi:hypothetical protein